MSTAQEQDQAHADLLLSTGMAYEITPQTIAYRAFLDGFAAGEASIGDMKPLFIPLKAEYFEAFERGEKKEEYRIYGPRWNEKTCAIGRAVVLSYGYGKKRRLRGVVVSFRIEYDTYKLPGWAGCYGLNDYGPAACIGIKVEGKL